SGLRRCGACRRLPGGLAGDGDDPAVVEPDATHDADETFHPTPGVGSAAPQPSLADVSYRHGWFRWHVRDLYLHLLDDDRGCRSRPGLDVAGPDDLWYRFCRLLLVRRSHSRQQPRVGLAFRADHYIYRAHFYIIHL